MLLTRKAAQQKVRLICLPEHWLIDKILKPENEVYRVFCALAKELNVYINLGGIYEKHGDTTFFLSPVISPTGEIIAKQKKVHLFGRENRRAIGGDRFEILEVDRVKVGIMVCHDVVFPESARTLVLKGAELLINPSLIVAEGVEPWQIYLKSRALENRVPIVAPNPYYFPFIRGKSVIFDLKYDKKERIMQVVKLIEATHSTQVIMAEIDLDDEAILRKERLKERKPNAYSN